MAREYKDFDDYGRQYGWAEAVEIGTFFEGIGILLKRKLVDIQLVDDLFTTPVKMAWGKSEAFSGRQQKTLEFSSNL